MTIYGVTLATTVIVRNFLLALAVKAACFNFFPLDIKTVITTFVILGQTYLQSLTIRLEEMRVKRRDSEQWMHHRMLPQDLRQRVRRYDQYKWLETRGVDEEYLVQNLPKDLRRDIKRHLCLALVRRVRALTILHSSFSYRSLNLLNSQDRLK